MNFQSKFSRLREGYLGSVDGVMRDGEYDICGETDGFLTSHTRNGLL
jgi:hypothetical protein